MKKPSVPNLSAPAREILDRINKAAAVVGETDTHYGRTPDDLRELIGMGYWPRDAQVSLAYLEAAAWRKEREADAKG